MDLHSSLAEFWRDEVVSALRARSVPAGDATEYYLVNLLVDFADPARIDEEPLALKLAQAADAPPEARARKLREIGDTSLYVSGFFADHLTRRTVDVGYYASMGGSAYGQLARGPAGAGALREAWAELAAGFNAFVQVLTEIKGRINLSTQQPNVLRLYEEWLKTGSDDLEQRLRAAGLLIGSGNGGKGGLPA